MSQPAASVGGGGAAGEERDELTFEAASKELDAIVERLERGEASLDETIALYERGKELYRICADKLDAAHGKIEELAKTDAAK